MPSEFPRLSSVTQRFTLGVPRNFAITEDGSHIMFLRSKGPTDSVNCLWLMDASSGAEYLLADPNELLGDGGKSDPTGGMDLPAAERDRRERARELAGGIVSTAPTALGAWRRLCSTERCSWLMRPPHLAHSMAPTHAAPPTFAAA